MALGDFSPEGAKNALDALSEMHKALSKAKQREYLGHMNEISLFIEGAQRVAEAQAQPAETPAGATPRVGDRAQCFSND